MAQMNTEAQAAYLLADALAHSLLVAHDSEKRTWLYTWERNGLIWLREWRKRDRSTPINSWTAHYVEFGPPPWESRGLRLGGK
jgi:hypothetical protein